MTAKQRKAASEYRAALNSYQATRSDAARRRLRRALARWLKAGGAVKFVDAKESAA